MTKNYIAYQSIREIKVGKSKARWPLVVGVVVALLLASVAVFCYVIYRGVDETRALAPWPVAGATAADVLAVDLAPLGLVPGEKQDPWQIYGREAAFSDAEVILYGTGGTVYARAAALRYPASDSAAAGFAQLQSWAQENCGWSTSAYWVRLGVIRCGWPAGHNRILWSDSWILDIETADMGELRAADLADKIRDATAAHWRDSAADTP